MTVPFIKQVEILKQELTKVFDYVELDEFYEARFRNHDSYQISKEDAITSIMYANYAGSLLRISYYKYVHKQGFDVRALADAAVIIYHFQNVYQFELEPHLKEMNVKEAISKTRYPKWTKFGLIGGNIKELNKLGMEFSQYMDSLAEAESVA